MPGPKINRQDGYTVSNDPELGVSEQKTVMCVHCGMHYVVRPGSGKVRGVCLMCYGPTCGRVGCDPCVPLEKGLEIRVKPNPTPGKNWRQRILEEGGRKRLWAAMDRVLNPPARS